MENEQSENDEIIITPKPEPVPVTELQVKKPTKKTERKATGSQRDTTSSPETQPEEEEKATLKAKAKKPLSKKQIASLKKATKARREKSALRRAEKKRMAEEALREEKMMEKERLIQPFRDEISMLREQLEKLTSSAPRSKDSAKDTAKMVTFGGAPAVTSSETRKSRGRKPTASRMGLAEDESLSIFG